VSTRLRPRQKFLDGPVGGAARHGVLRLRICLGFAETNASLRMTGLFQDEKSVSGARARGLRLRVFMHLYCAPGFVGRVAEIFEGAIDAFGFAGDAQGAAVPDDLVREEDPFFTRDDFH
jgi:hypothetical protein